MFLFSNDENKAYKVWSIFAEDEKNIETSENVLEIWEKRRNSEIEVNDWHFYYMFFNKR